METDAPYCHRKLTRIETEAPYVTAEGAPGIVRGSTAKSTKLGSAQRPHSRHAGVL